MIRALLQGALVCALGASAQEPAPPPPLTFEALLAQASRDPGLLRLEADLAARNRQLAATGGLFREGPTLTAEAGRRSGPLATGTDRVAQVDAPLLLAPTLRAGARASLDQVQRTLPPLAQAEARHRLRLAYLDAWLAQAQLHLRDVQFGLTQSWVQVAQARVDAGSDPAYQVDLVRGDLLRLQQEQGSALRRVRETWGTLRTLAELPPEPGPLADPESPALPPAAGLAEAFQQSLIRQAQRDQSAADRSAFDLQQALRASRWSLKGSYAAEGEERVTRLGLAFRLPRAGERGAERREGAAGHAALAREAEAAEALLDARFRAALARLAVHRSVLPPPRFAASLQAVDLRLQEGRERPSEALLIRRQLLEAENAALQQRHDAHALAAELTLLTLGAVR